jgi:hypothetical protein
VHNFSPVRTWPDSDIFIIGGGKSLDSFDWSLLRSELTIGCNDAYQLGIEVCKILVFCDNIWYSKHKTRLSDYQGRVFTDCPQLKNEEILGIVQVKRVDSGLHRDTLGYNGNSGAVALNLALILGAKRIFLLGFDMKLTDGDANWHVNEVNMPTAYVYPKFKRGFDVIAKKLPTVFPGAEIYNLTDDSALDVFPKISLNDFWKGKVKCGI